MTKNISQMMLWPTRIGLYDLDQMSTAQNDQLRAAVMERVDFDADEKQELRVHNLESLDCEAVRLLSHAIFASIEDYVGLMVNQLGLRAVVIRSGKHICTHTESHESDLMVAYWPGGNPLDRGEHPSIEPCRIDAPTFVVEDPSRHLTDLRLPGEARHSVCIKPRPGLLVIGPAHLPHNLHPYMGEEPFIHIVAQVRLAWPSNYENRW